MVKVQMPCLATCITEQTWDRNSHKALVDSLSLLSLERVYDFNKNVL